jgi:protein TonB
MHAGMPLAFSMNKNAASPIWQPMTIRPLASLALVILLHIGFFYALQNGLHPPAEPARPKEITAMLITPTAQPEPAQPQVAPPKPQPTPPKPKPAPAKPKPKLEKPIVKPKAPAPKPTPVPQTITRPPEPPAPAEPVVAAAPPAAPVAPPAPAAPAMPSAPAQPKMVTSAVEYIQAPNPVYSPLSKRMGEEGTVVLRILINENGYPEEVKVHTSSGFARLDESAREAALRARFKPYMENGRAIPVFRLAPITFKFDS